MDQWEMQDQLSCISGQTNAKHELPVAPIGEYEFRTDDYFD
jgi:hypothetical protein